jgi:type IV secretory pathway TraG/TraD family ATPase VirD4
MNGGEAVDWQRLKDEVGTYFIVLPGNEFETHGVWLRLVLGDCLDTLSKTRPGAERVGIKLNEVGHLKRIDALKRAQGMIRKNGVWLDTYWQDLNQVEEIYGPAGARSFWSNAGVKTTFGTDDPETMRIFSMRAGIRSVEVDSYNTGQKTDGKNRSVTGMNVLNPDDISALEDCTTYNFFHKVRDVSKLNTPHYTEIPECRGRFDPNPYHMAT